MFEKLTEMKEGIGRKLNNERVLEKLDTVEKELKEMEERQKKLSEIDRKLDKIKKGEGNKTLKTIKEDLKELKKEGISGKETAEKLSLIVDLVRDLKNEQLGYGEIAKQLREIQEFVLLDDLAEIKENKEGECPFGKHEEFKEKLDNSPLLCKKTLVMATLIQKRKSITTQEFAELTKYSRQHSYWILEQFVDFGVLYKEKEGRGQINHYKPHRNSVGEPLLRDFLPYVRKRLTKAGICNYSIMDIRDIKRIGKIENLGSE
ncbi:hypothetical protein AKJ58_00145 [candidate division MSBL1 archaeon SCGC-AAA385D11]|uniref:Uncharacterized protein n=1 Tax=candidate division MSBL1 archaeon SCGC-AAA385D11 TaxID=1698286 RepID=A0A133VPJ3_9EURY|nr:hypothetical protein AKJ58_00145 [candidate division MSBL1 archaeon SCGC-AAA385D11]